MASRISHHLKQWTLLAGFVALGVTLGYTFLSVPNVEMVTATIFLCGVLLGAPSGILCGLLTELIYGLFNPYGAAAPPLLIGMILAMAVTGAAGGFMGRSGSESLWKSSFGLSLAGALCTLNFAVLTTLAYLLSTGISMKQLFPSMITGLGFYLLHILSNTLIFFIVMPFLIRVTQRHWRRISMSAAFICLLIPAQSDAQSLMIDKTPLSGYRHLGDLAGMLPGIWVRDLGYLGHWAGLRMEGMSQAQSGALVYNGYYLEDPLSGLTDWRLIPVSGIRRISVAAFDSSGFLKDAPMLSVTDKQLESNQPYSRVVYRTGGDKFSDLDFAFGQKLSDKLKVLAGVLLQNEGDNETGGMLQKYHGQNVRIGLQYSPLQWMTLHYDYLHNKTEADSMLYPMVLPADSGGLVLPSFKRHRADHMLMAEIEAAGLRTEIRYHRTGLRYRLGETFDDQITELKGKQQVWQVQQRFDQRLPNLIWGIRATTETVHPKDSLHLNQRRFRGFVRSQYQWRSLFSLQANAIWHHGTEDHVLGRVRLTWMPEASASVWVGANRFIREPLSGERFGYPFYPTAPSTADHLFMRQVAGQIIPNHSLRSETTDLIETGLRFNRIRRLSVDLHGYMQEIHDVIRLAAMEPDLYRFDNLDTYHITGLDLSAGVLIGRGWTGRIVLNCLNATDRSDATLLERPNVWGHASVSWYHEFFEQDLKLTVMVQSRFRSDFYSIAGIEADAYQFYYHDPSALLDFKISANIMQNAVLSFAVENLLDAQTSVVSTYWMQGRTLRLSYYWELFD